jgi:hypothetical protein
MTFGPADMDRFFVGAGTGSGLNEVERMWALLSWAIENGYVYDVVIGAEEVKDKAIRVEWRGK